MPSLSKSFAIASATNVVVLVVNLATGIIVARLLGPTGRGEVAVLLTMAQIIGWIGAFGLNDAVTFLSSRHPERTGDVLATALLLGVVCGTLGFVIAQVALPFALAAQDPELLLIGRVFMGSIYLVAFTGLLTGVTQGNQDFSGMSMVRFLQPATYLAGLVGLWALGAVTVVSVLATFAASGAIALLYALVRLLRRQHVGRASRATARELAAYGFRVQGANVGNLGTTRLDLVVMPAVLQPQAIGLYSVATNSSSIVQALVGTLSSLLLPAATRRGPQEGLVLVARMLRLSMLAGTVLAAPLFLGAEPLLRLVYGPAFAGAATPLRILLFGVLLSICNGVVLSGLQALNRPLAATASQLLGLVVTLVGLGLTLRPLGIIGAAVTTVVAYGATLACAVILLLQDPNLTSRKLLSIRGLRADVGFVRLRAGEAIRVRR